MSTTVQQIVDGAFDRNEWNDQVVFDLQKTLAWLDRLVKRIYAKAAYPVPPGSLERDDFFQVSVNLALASSLGTALPTAVRSAAWLPPKVLSPDGRYVALVSRVNVAESIAELPPAVIWEGRMFFPTGRAEDLEVGDTLTLLYVPSPGPLTDVAHYIGATDPTDATTSLWPDHPGNEALIAELARYLARKDEADPQETEELKAEAAAETSALLAFLRGR